MGNFCGKCGAPLENGLCPNCDKIMADPAPKEVLEDKNYPWLFRKTTGGKTVASVFLCILLTLVLLFTFSLGAIKRGLSKDSIDNVLKEIPAMNSALTSVITDLCHDFRNSNGNYISESDINALANSPSFRAFISDKLSTYVDSAVNGKYWYITEDEIKLALLTARAEMSLDISDSTIDSFADWAFSGGKLNNAANDTLEEANVPKALTDLLSGPAYWILFGVAIAIVLGLILMNFSQGLNATGIALAISSTIVAIPLISLKFAAKNAVNYITSGAPKDVALDSISESDSILKIVSEMLSSSLWVMLIFLAVGIALMIVRKPLLKLFRSLFSKKAKA